MFIFYLKVYFVMMLSFFIIDLFWLGMAAKKFYRKHLSFILSPEVNWPAAFLFYLLYVTGLLIFGVIPGMEHQSLNRAMLYGFLYGFFTYATYDLTNLALIKNWPVKIVIVDILWGSLLCLAVAAVGYWSAAWLQ